MRALIGRQATMPDACVPLGTAGNEPLINGGPLALKRHSEAGNRGLRLNALFAISVNSPSMSMV